MVLGLIRMRPFASPATAWTTGLLLITVALGFAGAHGMDFVYDDHRVITGDPRAQSWAAWWDDVATGIRPLLKLSFLINWRSGLGAPGYLATNLMLHAGNTLLLWRIGLHLLPRIAPGDAAITAPAAFLAALLFAVHPAQAEAVTYFSGRSMPLMSIFLLSAFIIWLKRPGQPASDAIALGAFALALLARETAVVFPALTALVLCLAPRQPTGAWRLPVATALVVAIAGLAILAGHPGYRAFFAGAFAHGDALGNLPDAARGLHYLMLRFTGLRAGSIDPVLAGDAPLWLPLLLVPALAWLLVDPRRRRRHVWLVFGLAWFTIHVAPMYSLIPRAEPANDRHLYLAAWGPVFALAIGLCRLGIERGWRRNLAVASAMTLFLASSLGLDSRNRVLGDEQAIWQEVTRQAPGHARGWHNLGVSLHRRGQLRPARDAYCHALALGENPHSRRALSVLARQGMPACDPAPAASPAHGH